LQIHESASEGRTEDVRTLLLSGVDVDSRDHEDYTPLARAAASPLADNEMLELLIGFGADVSALVDDGRHMALKLAACSGDRAKTRCLLLAGANPNQGDGWCKTTLVRVAEVLMADPALVPMSELLLEFGANVDTSCDECTPLVRAAYRAGRFDLVRCLLDAGASEHPLEWTPLLKAMALGSATDVEECLKHGASIDETDVYYEMPMHIAARQNNVAKAEVLLRYRSEIDVCNSGRRTPLILAADGGQIEMLQWLIENQANIEHRDRMTLTAIGVAACAGKTEAVRLLLKAGAKINIRTRFFERLMQCAANEPTVRLLQNAGLEISDVSEDMKRQLIGLPAEAATETTLAEYRQGRYRRFGRTNPEVMNVPFWNAMIRSGADAHLVRRFFGDSDIYATRTIWCFDRMGMSFTELSDGRFVQIGGEHEDHYDPNFCIYNEVVIHARNGTFEVLGYPKEVLPPIDFHTATYWQGSIFIVGGLGYAGTRRSGVTPVYRLDCSTWSIEPVVTRGENPGWIYNHRAALRDAGTITINCGDIWTAEDTEIVKNTGRFELNLASMIWTRLHGQPQSHVVANND
jgi:ankyrin repeat protein